MAHRRQSSAMESTGNEGEEGVYIRDRGVGRLPANCGTWRCLRVYSTGHRSWRSHSIRNRSHGFPLWRPFWILQARHIRAQRTVGLDVQVGRTAPIAFELNNSQSSSLAPRDCGVIPRASSFLCHAPSDYARVRDEGFRQGAFSIPNASIPRLHDSPREWYSVDRMCKS